MCSYQWNEEPPMERQKELDLTGKVVIVTGASLQRDRARAAQDEHLRDRNESGLGRDGDRAGAAREAVIQCEKPQEYTGRLFWAEREMAEMGIPA
jgi:hypothetical protein